MNEKTKNFTEKYLEFENIIKEKYEEKQNEKSGENEHIGVIINKTLTNVNVKEEARKLRKCRNSFSHDPNRHGYLEPTDEACNKLDEIIQYLKNPKIIREGIEKGIITDNVYECTPGDKIKEVLEQMKNNLYTHIPVFENRENKRKYLGTITEAIITYRLSENIDQESNILQNITIQEVLESSKKENYLSNEEIVFISQNETLETIINIFHCKIEEGKRVGAIFVTNQGKDDEKLLGIITSRDIPKINAFI